MATATAPSRASANGKSTPAPSDDSILAVPIQRPDIAIVEVPLVGITDLIMHKFADYSKEAMLEKQQKKAAKAKDVRDPEKEFKEALHIIDPELPEEERYGFPCSGFKKAAVSACRNIDGIPMTLARGAFHVMGDLAPISYEQLVMREDIVRLNGKTADLRWRPMFEGWSTVLRIRYNRGVMSAEQIFNLYEIAGFAVGIGDWRPEKDGPFGQFQVRRNE